MTFSIVAADPEAGEVGGAVQSKFLAVGSLALWARGGVGAVATQSVAEVTFGQRGLDLLADGRQPEEVLQRLLKGDDQREVRQVGVVDASGRAASFTGAECYPHAGSLVGPAFACQGNLLGSEEVIPAMAGAFQTPNGPLPERMIQALRAGQRAGGDRRGQESAALLVVKPGGGYGGNHDRYIDLRVDHASEPIEDLASLLELHRFYLQRPADSDVLDADEALEREIDELLRSAGHPGSDGDVWKALFDFVAWENLEERWVGPGRIDRHVLAHLRRIAADAPSEGRTE